MLLEILGGLCIYSFCKSSEEKDYQRRKEELITRLNQEMQHMVDKERLRDEVIELRKELKAKMPPKWDDDIAY
mgnify:CR=1 FL=1|tara:strand:+ start:4254 stop:4472 length:219 start_codon:yes stop_codon:yes gene_type:complete